MQAIIPRIMGWLIVVITLALAPTINTANQAIATSGNLTSDMIGMSIVVTFGAPLMILSLLVSGGMFGMGKVGDGTVQGMLGVIGAVILTLVALTMFATVLDYVYALVSAATGFGLVIYGIIPIVLYVGIIAGAGSLTIYKAIKQKRRSGGKRSFSRAEI